MTGHVHTIRLCDDQGFVSDEPVQPGSHGTEFAPTLTYRGLLNNLRTHTGLAPYTGAPFHCTGSGHLAGMHIRCTSPAHDGTAGGPMAGGGSRDPLPPRACICDRKAAS